MSNNMRLFKFFLKEISLGMWFRDKLSAQAILRLTILACLAGFLSFKFFSLVFASEYTSALKFFVWGIPLFLVMVTVLFLIGKILSKFHRLAKKVEQICPLEGGIGTKSIYGQTGLTQLEESLDLLARNLKEKQDQITTLNRRLLALNAVATAVNQTLEMDRMFGDVLETIMEVTSFDWGIVYLLDEKKNSLKVKTWRGIEVDEISEFDQIRMGEGVFGQAAQQEQILFVSDVEKDGRSWDNRLKDKKVKSILAIPFVAKGELLGVVGLGSLHLRELSLEENEFLIAICQQVGMAIDNINLLSSWAKKAKDLSLLLDISHAVSSSLDLGQVLEALSRRMAEIVEAELCYVALLDENRKALEIEAVHSAQKLDFESIGKVDFIGKKRRLSLEVLPRHRNVIKTGKMASIMRGNKITDVEREFSFADTVEEVVMMPLSVGQRILGIAGLGLSFQHKLDLEKLNLCKSVTSQAAIAIENAQLYEYVKQRVNEIYTVYNVGRSLSTILDLDQLLDEILRVIVGSFGYLNCAILLLDEKTNELYLKTSRGFPEDSVKNLRLKVGKEGIAGWVAQSGRPLIVGDVSKDSRYMKAMEECKSEVAVPLKLKDRVVGVLDAESEKLFAFTQKDVRILSQLGSQIAIAIENSCLFQEERKRSLQLALINDVGRKVVSTLDLDKLLRRVIESIQINFKYNHVSLFLMDESSEELVLKTYFGKDGDSVQEGLRLKVGVGMVGWTAESKKTFCSNDVSKESKYIPAIPNTKSALSVPLKSGQKVLGVLEVESFKTNAFDDRDVVVLETLADFLATALNNVKLYEETRKKAHRLALTDQINRAISSTLDLGSIFKIVSQELKRVVEYHRISLSFWRPEQHSFEMTLVFCQTQESYALQSTRTGTAKGGKLLGSKSKSEGRMILADDTAMYEVVKTQKPYYVPVLTLENRVRPMDRLMYSEGIKSYVLVPILSAGSVGGDQEVIAVLGLENKNSFGFESEQIELLNSIGSHLSVAIKNAQLFSDLENAYEDLMRAQDRLIKTEKLQRWGEMAGGVVHDFNNILTSILGRTQLLWKKLEREKAEGSENLIRDLQLIEKSITDGAKILSRIQEFTKTKKDTNFSLVNLNEIVEDSLEMTESYRESKAALSGIRIKVKKDLESIGEISGNATELREVVTNLIINAVDAMPQGGILTLKSHQDEESIYLVINDTGIGMSEEIKNKIFEPFFTTKGDQGTGLGLSVAYSIMARHEGEIEVRSSPGQGSTFTIKLPKCRETRISEKTKKLSGEQSRVLIIEDEKNIREVLDETLSAEGYEVTCAATGMEGIELFKKKEFDLVITDLGIPNMSGWEVADQIKSINPSTPVVLSTGWRLKLDPVKMKSQNVDRVIKKPFNLEQVLEVVSDLMDKEEKMKIVRMDP
jgi:GAF domain-containing protein/ActR/RegA family two-component response regulator/anti-sigma regulatory factor (Ser/Thr protein kinase)